MQKRKRGSKMECFKICMHLWSLTLQASQRWSTRMLGHHLEPALKAFPSFCHQGILKANSEYLLRMYNLLSGVRASQWVTGRRSLYIISLKKDKALRCVESPYSMVSWPEFGLVHNKKVNRYKRYGDLSNTWEPKVKTIFFYTKVCNHVAFRASHSLRYEVIVFKKNLVGKNWVKHTNQYMQTSTVLFFPLCFQFLA